MPRLYSSAVFPVLSLLSEHKGSVATAPPAFPAMMDSISLELQATLSLLNCLSQGIFDCSNGKVSE